MSRTNPSVMPDKVLPGRGEVWLGGLSREDVQLVEKTVPIQLDR